MSARLAADATTSSACADISSVAALTSSAAAEFSSLTAAIESIDVDTVRAAAVIRAAAALVWVAIAAIASDAVTTWLVAPPICERASKTWPSARSRSAAAVLISTRAAADFSASSEPTFTSLAPWSIAATARSVSLWTSAISDAISLVARLERSASFRTSSATTAKPLPCSPARAASMAALSARRLVCSAMSSIVSTMAPIWPDFAPSSPTRPAVVSTASRIRRMPVDVWSTASMPFSSAVCTRFE